MSPLNPEPKPPDYQAERTMNAADVIAAHQQTGVTKFSHRNGSSYVEYPKCRCGERIHPQAHPQHVADALAAAGCLA